MYKSSCPQFLRTTTEIQLGPDVFDKFKVQYNLFNHLEVTEILCSFRLVLEDKLGKGIAKSSRSEFLEKYLAKKFASSDAEDNTSGPLKRGGIAGYLC